MDANKVLEELIQTIERTAVNNTATISNVKLWAKSWREELRLHSSYSDSLEMFVRNCGNCKTETLQKVELYNPDNPDHGEVWKCSVCKEATDWVTT